MGKIVKAHGIRGVVKVYAYTASTSNFDLYDAYILTDTNGRQQIYERLWAKPHNRNIVRLALKNVTSRAEAQSLAGSMVMIPRDQLPPLEDDTYYWSDLIGMAARLPNGEYLGRVKQILPTGANDVYVIERPADCHADEILLPAIASVVLEIDLSQRVMVVAIPEGLS